MPFNIKKYYHDSLYRNSIAMMLNSAFGAFFGLLFWIVAARTIPSKDIGLATSAISAAGIILGLSTLGLSTGLIRYLPESKDKNELYSSVTAVPLALSLFLAAVFLVGINFFSPALEFLREGWFLLVFVAYIAISSIYSIQSTMLIATRRADLNFIQNLLLGLRIPIMLFIASLGIIGVFSALWIAYVIAFIFGIFMLYKCGLSFTSNFDLMAVKKMLNFSLGNYTAGLIGMAPSTIIPLMIVNTIGAESSAYFYIAYSVAGLLTMVPTAVSMSLFVEGSHNLPLKENVIKSMRLILLLQVPALAFIFLFGDRLLLLFSKEYSEQSFAMLQLLSVSSVFSAIVLVYLSIKRVQKDIKMVNYVSFALSVLLVGLGYLSLLKYGLTGLGYVWLGANAAMCILVAWIAIRSERWI